MGNPLYELSCDNCQHKQELFYGFYRNGDYVKLYNCANCKELKSIIYPKDSYKKGQLQYCEICKAKLEEINITLPQNLKNPVTVTPQLHCPNCKSENIKVFFSGFWD